jgi:tetratricopeptide (TPR) repeat protein
MDYNYGSYDNSAARLKKLDRNFIMSADPAFEDNEYGKRASDLNDGDGVLGHHEKYDVPFVGTERVITKISDPLPFLSEKPAQPESALTWNKEGVVIGKLGKNKEALECFDKAIEIEPDYAKAWNNKGVVLDDLGRHEEALECFDKAIEIEPDYAKAWNNKGAVLDDLGRHEEAIKCFEKANNSA